MKTLTPLFVKISFNGDHPEKTTVETDIKARLVTDILCEYLLSVAGEGTANEQPMVKRDVYSITLTLDVTHDTFTLTHDCGSKSLAVGIIGMIINMIEGGEIILPVKNDEADQIKKPKKVRLDK